MMNAALTQKKLDNFASELEERDPDAAANLRDLGSAIDGGPTADAWAFSDIRGLINPDRISDNLSVDAAADPLARWLEILRNSLVLLPLAITWFGIALAVDGYYRLIQARPDLAGSSFIYLWQSGFDGRSWLPLGTLALIDGFLLASVFLLTMAAYVRSAWVSMHGEHFGNRFRQELSQALAESELILSPRRGPQQYAAIHQLEKNVQDLLDQVALERQRLDELAQKRERELGDLLSITDPLKNSAGVFLNAAQLFASTQSTTLASFDGVTSAVKGLNVTQGQVTNAIRDVTDRVDGLLASQLEASEQTNTLVTKLVESTGTRIEGLIAAQQIGMGKLMKDQQAGARGISGLMDGMIAKQKEGIDQIVAVNQSTLATAAQLDTRLAKQQERIDQIVAEQQATTKNVVGHIDSLLAGHKEGSAQIAARIEGLVAEQQRVSQCLEQFTNDGKSTAEGISSVLSVFTRSTRDLAGVGDIMSNLAKEQNHMIKTFEDATSAQERVAIMVSRSNAGVENALNQISESSSTIRGIAADLTLISQKLPDLMGPIRTDMSSISNQYRDTASSLARASSDLDVAIGGIEKSLRGLDPILKSIAASTDKLSEAMDNLDKHGSSNRRL